MAERDGRGAGFVARGVRRCRRTPACRAAPPCRRSSRARPGPAPRLRPRRALRSRASRATRRGKRMAARQREPRGAFEQVRRDRRARCATRGSGSVSVPVLSKITVSISARRSIASPELRITPARNSAPDATTCTAGIASASAHGQVMISTAIAVTIEIVHARRRRRASRSRSARRSRAPPAHRAAPRGRRGAHSAICAVDGLFQQPLDLVDQRARAGRGHAHRERAGEIHAAGMDRGAGSDGAPARSRRSPGFRRSRMCR